MSVYRERQNVTLVEKSEANPQIAGPKRGELP